MASNILVIGSSNTDMVVKTGRFPRPGETIIGGTFFMFPGGKGANQAVAAARMGGAVTMVCKVGEDVFGQRVLAGLLEEGIETRFVASSSTAASGVALITVDERGENQIVVAGGANSQLSLEDVRAAEAALRSADIVLLQLETPFPTVAFAVEQAANLGKRVMLNPAPARPLPDSVLSSLFLITPNETEAELLTGIPVNDEAGARQAATALLARGVRNVVITLGARGAYFQNEAESFPVSAPQVRVVDTTAAGDVFNGALAVALAEGLAWRQALELACRAASLSVTMMGAQSSAPFRRELAKR